MGQATFSAASARTSLGLSFCRIIPRVSIASILNCRGTFFAFAGMDGSKTDPIGPTLDLYPALRLDLSSCLSSKAPSPGDRVMKRRRKTCDAKGSLTKETTAGVSSYPSSVREKRINFKVPYLANLRNQVDKGWLFGELRERLGCRVNASLFSVHSL